MMNRAFPFHPGVAGVLLLAGSLAGFQPAAAQDGKQIFQQSCAACHSIGGGKLLGPDLSGVTDKRSENWLIAYIKSQDAVLKSGDKTAQALLDEYKVPMPDQPLSDKQIKTVLAHIKAAGGSPAAASGSATAAAETKPAAAAEPTPDEVRLGQQLFEGSVRLANGGPACNACHHVDHAAVTGGGILARDLTVSFSRMGKEGIGAMLGNAPFPVMQVAYEGKPLNASEVQALVGFLQQADKEHESQLPRHYGWGMFFGGTGGVAALLGFFAVVGGRRKKRSVNQEIYDRQAKSE
jgi:mono/diheme cytochrome c family protein